MSFWARLLGRRRAEKAFGLDLDNPVMCGGEVAGEVDYLERLRCPAGQPIRFKRIGSLTRTSIDYLERKGVEFRLARRLLRRPDEMDPRELPLDAYLINCECGHHQERIFLDMYFRGPELAIGKPGWTLAEGAKPADPPEEKAVCPYCGKELRTPRAKQCRACLMDWHDPDNVFRGRTDQLDERLWKASFKMTCPDPTGALIAGLVF